MRGFWKVCIIHQLNLQTPAPDSGQPRRFVRIARADAMVVSEHERLMLERFATLRDSEQKAVLSLLVHRRRSAAGSPAPRAPRGPRIHPPVQGVDSGAGALLPSPSVDDGAGALLPTPSADNARPVTPPAGLAAARPAREDGSNQRSQTMSRDLAVRLIRRHWMDHRLRRVVHSGLTFGSSTPPQSPSLAAPAPPPVPSPHERTGPRRRLSSKDAILKSISQREAASKILRAPRPPTSPTVSTTQQRTSGSSPRVAFLPAHRGGRGVEDRPRATLQLQAAARRMLACRRVRGLRDRDAREQWIAWFVASGDLEQARKLGWKDPASAPELPVSPGRTQPTKAGAVEKEASLQQQDEDDQQQRGQLPRPGLPVDSPALPAQPGLVRNPTVRQLPMGLPPGSPPLGERGGSGGSPSSCSTPLVSSSPSGAAPLPSPRSPLLGSSPCATAAAAGASSSISAASAAAAASKAVSTPTNAPPAGLISLASNCASTIDRLVSSGKIGQGNGEEFAAAAQLLVQMQRLCSTLEASTASSTSLLDGSANGAGRGAATCGVSPPTRPLPSPLASAQLAALLDQGDGEARVPRPFPHVDSAGDMDELDDMVV